MISPFYSFPGGVLDTWRYGYDDKTRVGFEEQRFLNGWVWASKMFLKGLVLKRKIFLKGSDKPRMFIQGSNFPKFSPAAPIFPKSITSSNNDAPK